MDTYEIRCWNFATGHNEHIPTPVDDKLHEPWVADALAAAFSRQDDDADHTYYARVKVAA